MSPRDTPVSQNGTLFYMYQNDISFRFVCMYICIIHMYMVLYLRLRRAHWAIHYDTLKSVGIQVISYMCTHTCIRDCVYLLVFVCVCVW